MFSCNLPPPLLAERPGFLRATAFVAAVVLSVVLWQLTSDWGVAANTKQKKRSDSTER